MLLLGRGRRRRALPPPPRRLPEKRPDRLAENAALALLVLVTGCSVAFIGAYIWEAPTQLLGLTLGLAFAALGTASVLASRRLVPQEKIIEARGPERDIEAEQEAAQLVEEAGSGLTRRRLLLVAAGGAVGALGAATLVPAASLGPLLEEQELLETPWRTGLRLVDERGQPIGIDELEVGTFVTAFPESAPKRNLDSPLIVVRLRAAELELPPERSDWAPGGVLAFSKICTHAACAVSLFRYPEYAPTSPRPALVCPCHYSAFDPRRGGDVIFGPAVRPLPQLPLRVSRDRTLVAAGPLSGAPGPSWWKVRRERG